MILKVVPSFDDRFKELMEFKKKFGHCNVHVPYGKELENGKYFSLGNWCFNIKSARALIKEGRVPDVHYLKPTFCSLRTQISISWLLGGEDADNIIIIAL